MFHINYCTTSTRLPFACSIKVADWKRLPQFPVFSCPASRNPQIFSNFIVVSDGPYDIFPYLPSPLVKNKSIYALPYYPDYNEGKIFLPFVYASYTIPQNIHWENDGSLPICISVLPYIPHIPPFWHVCMSVINGWCSQFPLWKSDTCLIHNILFF